MMRAIEFEISNFFEVRWLIFQKMVRDKIIGGCSNNVTSSSDEDGGDDGPEGGQDDTGLQTHAVVAMFRLTHAVRVPDSEPLVVGASAPLRVGILAGYLAPPPVPLVAVLDC